MKIKKITEYGLFILAIVALGSLIATDKKFQTQKKEYGLGKYIYGAEMDAWTEDIKQEQRANAKEFLSQLESAIKNGERELKLTKKHYRFNAAYLGSRGQALITMRDVQNFTLNGNGAEFWFENYTAGLSIDNCKNMTIKDLTMDWDPLPFSQILVSAVDSISITGETESGFRNMTDILKEVRRPVLKIFIFDAKTGLIKHDVAHSEPDSIKDLGNKRMRIYGRAYGGYKYNKMNVKPGDRIAIVMRLTHGLRIRKSDDITFVNFNMYSSPMFGITMGDGGGGLVLQNVKLTPRPNTKRLMGMNGDAVHLTSLTKGPLIENSEFVAPGDDVMNIHGDFGLIQQQVSPTKVIVGLKNYRNIDKGSTIQLYDYTTLKSKGSFKVIGVEEGDADSRADAKKVGQEKRINFWPGNGSIICELDKPVTVSRYDVVESMDDIGPGAIIRNNYLHNLTTRGFLIQTKNALIEDNTFSHVDNAAIAIMGSLDWCESPFPENITIRNNIIRDTNIGLGSRYASHAKIGAISINIEYRGALKENVRPINNIVIENNKIYHSATLAIFMIHANKSKIQNNLIDGFNEVNPLQVGRNLGVEPYAGIYIGDSEQISISVNKIINGGKYTKENITIGKYADKSSITIKN